MNAPTYDRTRVGELCVVTSAVLFGLMPLFAKIAAEHGSNAYMSALGRFFFGSVFLLAVLAFRRDAPFRVSWRQLLKILPLSVLYAVTPVLLFASYDYMDSGLATALHFTFPVMVILFSALFFHVRPNGRQMICAVLGTVGVSQFAGGEAEGATGLFLAVASGATYAMYIVLLGRSSLASLPVLTMAFWLSLMASAEIAAVAAWKSALTFALDNTAWGAILALAVFATALALALFQEGLSRCGAMRASLLSTFEPLTGVGIGWLVFSEALTPKTAAGILCVLLASVLLLLPVPLPRMIRGRFPAVRRIHL